MSESAKQESLEGFRNFEVHKRDHVDPDLLEMREPILRVSFGFRLATKCRFCQTALPINAITKAILCAGCGKTTELSEKWWDTALGESELATAFVRRTGVGGGMRVLGGGLSTQFRRIPPHCLACSTALPDDLVNRLTGTEQLACPACKTTLSLRPAGPLAKKISSSAQFLIGEGPRSDGESSEPKLSKAARPVVLSCMKCGGALEVDGSSRLVHCQYCNSDNYLPDDLWFHMHPRATIFEFYLVADLNVEQRLRWLVREEEVAVAVAQTNQAMNPELLQRLVAHKEYEVRKAIARSSHLSDADYARLATDKDYEVRLALAKNKKCPPAILRELAGDDDSDVVEAASRNSALPTAAVSDQVHSDDYSTRQAAAQRKNLKDLLSRDEILKLAGDGDSDVQAAVMKNPSFPVVIIADEIIAQEDLAYLRPKLLRRAAELSPELRLRMAHSEDYALTLAQIESIDPEVLAVIARNSKMQGVRAAVAGHANAGAETIRRLSCDREPEVARIARQHQRYSPPGIFEWVKFKFKR